ncbi:MAG: muconolactone Delta-isomerase family protein, partial [Polynucleobacter victoriensis]
MLFHVTMTVNLPIDMPAEQSSEIKRIEKEYAQKLQADGKWRHLWRVVGEYANVSIFDVSGNEELHNILSNLPLFP